MYFVILWVWKCGNPIYLTLSTAINIAGFEKKILPPNHVIHKHLENEFHEFRGNIDKHYLFWAGIHSSFTFGLFFEVRKYIEGNSKGNREKEERNASFLWINIMNC